MFLEVMWAIVLVLLLLSAVMTFLVSMVVSIDLIESDYSYSCSGLLEIVSWIQTGAYILMALGYILFDRANKVKLLGVFSFLLFITTVIGISEYVRVNNRSGTCQHLQQTDTFPWIMVSQVLGLGFSVLFGFMYCIKPKD